MQLETFSNIFEVWVLIENLVIFWGVPGYHTNTHLHTLSHHFTELHPIKQHCKALEVRYVGFESTRNKKGGRRAAISFYLLLWQGSNRGGLGKTKFHHIQQKKFIRFFRFPHSSSSPHVHFALTVPIDNRIPPHSPLFVFILISLTTKSTIITLHPLSPHYTPLG